MQPIMEVKGVSRRENGDLILQRVFFEQQRGQKIAIAGETGSGKTTLLKIIAGLIQPSSGEVLFEGHRVPGPEEKLIPGHPSIAYLSQHFELRNNYRVEEELEAANRLPAGEAKMIEEICKIQHLLKRKTTALSGGERQRIVLAKLLLGSPHILLLDEPFSNLDNIHKQIIREVIAGMGEKMNLSCIMVSHDAPDILSWADHVILMKEGQILQQGTAEQVYGHPGNEYCAALLGHYNLVPASFFSEITGVTSGVHHLVIRPEQIRIEEGENHGLRGRVIRNQFFGNYSLVQIDVMGQILQAKANGKHFSPGDAVHLSLDMKSFAFLSS